MATWLDAGSRSDLHSDACFLGEAALVKLFIKYNTAVPSSASVERFFSIGKDILRDKRATLSDENFNILMFLKGNQHLRQYRFTDLQKSSASNAIVITFCSALALKIFL